MTNMSATYKCHDTDAVAEKRNSHVHHLLQLASVFSVLIIMLVIWLMYLQPQLMPIKQVRISGEFEFLLPHKLKTMSTNHVRGGFFNVNVGGIRELLESEPWVSNVSVRRVWPDTLVVYVDEHKPLTRWNENYLISTKGVLFSPDKNSMPVGIPILSGPEESHEEILNVYIGLQQEVARAGHQISAVSMDQRGSLSFKIDGGPEVMLGKRNFSERLGRFVDYVALQLNSELGKATVIDLRYTNGFSVRNSTGELLSRND